MNELKVTIGNSFCHVSKHFNALPEYAQNKFVKSLSYMKRFNLNSREIYLFFKNPNHNNNSDLYYKMPTGLLHRFWMLAKEYKIPLQFQDQREADGDILPIEDFFKRLSKANPDIQERQYQIDAIKQCLVRKRGIIEHSTAAGKTVIIAGVIYCLNRKTLVVCVGKEHINQISKDIEQMVGRKLTIVGAGMHNFSGQVVIATMQSLEALLKSDPEKFKEVMSSFRCVIGDEVHRAASDSYKHPFYYSVNAKYKLGFSGTVFREDGAMLEIEAAVGPVIDKKDYSFLQENNYIVQAKFFFIDPMSAILTGAPNYWPDCVHHGIVHDAPRNKLIADAANVYMKKGKQVLIITPLRVEHGRILQDLIPNSRFMYGDAGDGIRKDALRDFKNKKFMVLIGTRLYDEVINLPDVRAIILAGGGKAHNAFFQRVGRGIRKAENKSHVEIVIPWDSHSSVLLKHSRKLLSYIRSVRVWEKEVKFIGPHRKSHALERGNI